MSDRTDDPTLVIVAGGVASGKSTFSRALAARLGAVRFEADRVRGTLLGKLESADDRELREPGEARARAAAAEGEEGGAEARWRRDLSPEFEDEIYADLLRRAAESLAAGSSVVLDACFPRRRHRDSARRVAARANARFLFVECRVSDATLRERLAERDSRAARPGWEAIARALEKHAEPADELSAHARIAVRGDAPTEGSVDLVVARLRAHPRVTPSLRPHFVPAPEVVSFDCWSTLLVEEDWPWAHALRVAALRDAAREAGLDASVERVELAFDAAWRRHMALWAQGTASGAREVAHWGLAELGLGEIHPAIDHLVRRFEEASHTSRVTPVEGARSLLQMLDETGTACVLVCDTGLTPGRVVRKLLDGAGLLQHLRVLSFSDEVGFPKPDARAFRAAIEPLGSDPSRVLHVGDLRRTDVAGARALGMHTVRIRAPHDDTSDLEDADHVVDSHAELAALLGLQLSDVEIAPAGSA